MCNDTVNLRNVYAISYIELLFTFVHSIQIVKRRLNWNACRCLIKNVQSPPSIQCFLSNKSKLSQVYLLLMCSNFSSFNAADIWIKI